MSQQEEFKKKMWNVVTPHIYGDQAPKTPTKAISIYDIEKEKQKVRDLENANAQGEAYGFARLSAPVYQPQKSEVPIIENADEILAQQPKQEVKEEAKIEQPKSFYSQFLDMTKAPITAEEQARRDRASRAVQATGALGNLMSAFANLTFTGKGAPSQALPTQAVDKIGSEMTSWQDKLASEREKYAAAMLGAKTQQWKMEQEERRYAQMQANADRAYEFQVKQHEDNKAIDKAKVEAEAAETKQRMELEKQRISIARQEANTRLSEAKRKDKPYPMVVDGQLYEIPINRINEQMVGTIFAKLPKEVRNAAGEPIYGDTYDKTKVTGYKNPSLSDMLAAIGTYGNEETAAIIKSLANGSAPKAENDARVEEKEEIGGKGDDANRAKFAEYMKSTWNSGERTDFSQYKRK